MLVIKAFHIIAIVAWFAGLFYLPRLFVYHAETHDEVSLARFKIMERRLYYGITWPAGILATILGILLLTYNVPYYFKAAWMHTKLFLIVLLWWYHLGCGSYLKAFTKGKNKKSARFYRVYNELPTLLLVGIVLLVVVRPF